MMVHTGCQVGTPLNRKYIDASSIRHCVKAVAGDGQFPVGSGTSTSFAFVEDHEPRGT